MELTNPQDPFAVAVIKDGCVVGHVPRTVSRTVSFFLGKDGSVGFCEVTGAMVKRTAGFSLEMCVPVLWTPGLYREAQEPRAVAKNFTDRS